MDLVQLESVAASLLENGLASSTRRTYSSGQTSYLSFCSLARLAPLPSSENILCLFVAWLASSGLSHATIKVYLAAVRQLHISAGRANPFLGDMPRLNLVLRGYRRSESARVALRPQRLPITPAILRALHGVWSKESQSYDSVLWWAACLTGFFGFLRSGEFTVASGVRFDPEVHLALSDLSFDTLPYPTMALLRIKQSKTDPFRRGHTVVLGRLHSDLCPVASLLSYLVIRGMRRGSLFCKADGWPLCVRT